MKNFIDESGSFVYTTDPNSWCVVGCYSIPDPFENQIEEIFAQLHKVVCKDTHELKLKSLSENQYLEFLNNLQQIPGIFHAVVTDSSHNTTDGILYHQEHQVDSILENKDKMLYESGKTAINNLGIKLKNLSPQLYIQLTCQMELMYRTLQSVIMYYVQRYPETLTNFSWLIDAKNQNLTKYEETFEILTPVLLQTLALDNPIMVVEEFNYFYMNEFIVNADSVPEYLREKIGKESNVCTFNVQKIIRDDIQFVNSNDSIGVQIVDLLVSGLRRCMRMEWCNNDLVARSLGALMVQQPNRRCPLYLISLCGSASVTKDVERVVQEIASTQRIMFKRT